MFRDSLLSRLAVASRRLLAGAVTLSALLIGAGVDAAVDERSLKLTPPRLGLVEGDVSFWRPGAGDWETAQINIPLAPGDALAARQGQFELQIGGQSFARAGDGTQLRLKSLEPDFLQFEVTQGSVVLDLRQHVAGHVVAIDTPNARFSTTQDGYYRVDVSEAATRLTVRRAGAATLTPNDGSAMTVGTGETVQLAGSGGGQLEMLAAPAFDEWDRWNYERADSFLAAPRPYSVASDVYGSQELEQHGNWRYVSDYGRVWVPYSVPAGWAPYTAGRWLYDPIYGYSWVDYAPWGWAPFHYGRWVYAGYWAWAPGPVLVAPVYSPALVAFYGPSIAVNVGFGVPYVGWVALGWGEPLIPWWGSVGFVGNPCWWGWGGPRVVNNINIYNGDVVNADQINFYRNSKVPGGLVGVPKDKFHGFPVSQAKLDSLRAGDLKPWKGGKLPLDGGRQLGSVGAAGAGKGGVPNLTSRRQQAQAVPAEFTRRASAAERGTAKGGPPPLGGMPKSGTSSAFQRLNERGASAASNPAGGFQRGGAGGSAGAKNSAATDAFQRLGERGGAAASKPATVPSSRRATEMRRGAASSGAAAKGSLPPYERLRGASSSRPSSTAASAGAVDMRRSARRYASAEPPAFDRGAAAGKAAGSAPRRAPYRTQGAATVEPGAAAPSTAPSSQPSAAAPRSAARSYERAPVAEFRGMAKNSLPSMPSAAAAPNVSAAPSGGGMPSGGAMPSMRNFSSGSGGGGGGGSMRSGGGTSGGGGMRNFSR